MVTALTEAGLGVSFLPVSLMQDRIKARALQPIEVTPAFPTLQFSVAHMSHSASPAVHTAVRMLRECSTFKSLD